MGWLRSEVLEDRMSVQFSFSKSFSLYTPFEINLHKFIIEWKFHIDIIKEWMRGKKVFELWMKIYFISFLCKYELVFMYKRSLECLDNFFWIWQKIKSRFDSVIKIKSKIYCLLYKLRLNWISICISFARHRHPHWRREQPVGWAHDSGVW